ncbi:MAG: cysteine peptidase family C39 domain-containing protein [Clostridia bacterium]
MNGYKNMPIILAQDSQAASACLSMILAYYGKKISYTKLAYESGALNKGNDIDAIIKCANNYGIKAQLIAPPVTEIVTIATPCLLLYKGKWCVLNKIKDKYAIITATDKGRKQISMEEFLQNYSGKAVTVALKDGFNLFNENAFSANEFIKKQLQTNYVSIIFISLSYVLASIVCIVLAALMRVFVDRIIVGIDYNWTSTVLFITILAVVALIILIAIKNSQLLKLRNIISNSAETAMLEKLQNINPLYFACNGSEFAINHLNNSKNIGNDVALCNIKPLFQTFFVLIIAVYILIYNPLLALPSITFTVAIITLSLLIYFNIINSKFKVVCFLLAIVMQIVSLIIGIFVAINSDISLGTVIAFQFLTAIILTTASMLPVNAEKMQKIPLDLIRFEDVMGLDITQTNEINNGIVEFENVSFGYNLNSTPILKNITFKTNTSDLILVSGKSGSGKTTLLKLIAGEYSAWSGIRRYNGKELKTKISDCAYIGNGVVWNGSVMDNLKMFNDSITDEMVISAANEIGLTKQILQNKEGFNYKINNDSDNISSSLRNLIALTRLLIFMPKIALIDEISVTIGENENALLEALKKRNINVFIVTNSEIKFDKLINLNE